jgi:hypothetical protein
MKEWWEEEEMDHEDKETDMIKMKTTHCNINPKTWLRR